MSRTRTTRAVHIAPAGDSSSGFVVVDCFSLIIGSPSSSVPAAAAMVCFWIDRPFLPWVFVGIYIIKFAPFPTVFMGTREAAVLKSEAQ